MTLAYIFQADIYCEDCGRDIRTRLTMDGNAPSNPSDECTYDSDNFPKGPYSDGGGEADCPQHCAQCRAFLENSLTQDGYEFVREAIRNAEEKNLADRPHIQLWRAFYDLPKAVWMVYNPNEKDSDTNETLYWSNLDGWVVFESADTFTDGEKQALTLPIGGIWEAVE